MGLNGKADSLSSPKDCSLLLGDQLSRNSLDTSPWGKSESHFRSISALESNPLTSKFQLQ